MALESLCQYTEIRQIFVFKKYHTIVWENFDWMLEILAGKWAT